MVTLLLSKGANKEHRNISDYTPLSQAASGGSVSVIKVLLSHGAEINSRFVACDCCDYLQAKYAAVESVKCLSLVTAHCGLSFL